MSRKTLAIDFGALCPKISEQLRAQKLQAPNPQIEGWQLSADAITRLNINGILPDFQARQARQRLFKKIAGAFQ